MTEGNASDLIENYLKRLLADENEIQIRRTDMADYFHVVPSQINYVIKTRFTLPKGYSVVSKRGGGGYIRITKVTVSDNKELLSELRKIVGDSINASDTRQILDALVREKVISTREMKISELLLGAAPNSEIESFSPEMRADMLQKLLKGLTYEK